MSFATDKATAFLPDLDDSNIVSSYKNEQAAAVIRDLLAEIEFQSRQIKGLVRDFTAEQKRTEPSTVWALGVYYDNGGYHPSLELSGEEVFFASREDGDKWIEDKQGFLPKWQRYVEATDIANRAALARFEDRQKDWEKVKAAGLTHLMSPPVRAQVVKPLDFEAWSARQEYSWGLIELDLRRP